MNKKAVIELLDSFEDEFDIEKLISKLVFIEQVEKGLRDVQECKLVDYESVKEKLN